MEAQTYALLMGLDLATDEGHRDWHSGWPLLGLTLAIANLVLVGVM